MQEGRAGLPDSAVKSERYERGESSMMKKQKIMLYRIIAAAVIYVPLFVLEHMGKLEFKISNSYSPGYCGWHVTQQKFLFSLLPEQPCGVRLSESSLMSPIKSVSGVIAVGERIVKRKYGCELCGKADCYKNRNKLKK